MGGVFPPQTSKNPLISATFSCVGLLELRPASVSSLLMSAFLGSDQTFGLYLTGFPSATNEAPELLLLSLSNVWRGDTYGLPSLHPESPDYYISLFILNAHQFLHPPLADPASSV